MRRVERERKGKRRRRSRKESVTGGTEDTQQLEADRGREAQEPSAEKQPSHEVQARLAAGCPEGA